MKNIYTKLRTLTPYLIGSVGAYTAYSSKTLKESPRISNDEIKTHNTVNSCWMVRNGTVFQVAKEFFEDKEHSHPGGNIAKHACGKNIDEFWKQYPFHYNKLSSARSYFKTNPYFKEIGKQEKQKEKEAQKETVAVPINEEMKHGFQRNHHPFPEIKYGPITINNESVTLSRLQDYPFKTLNFTIECAGNKRVQAELYNQPTNGRILWRNAIEEWRNTKGVLLTDIFLNEDFSSEKKILVAEGYDGFKVAIPLSKIPCEAMIAYHKDSKLIPHEKGGIRLIMPGKSGFLHIKWLKTLSIKEIEKPEDVFEITPSLNSYKHISLYNEERSFSYSTKVKNSVTSHQDNESVTYRNSISGITHSGNGIKIKDVTVIIKDSTNQTYYVCAKLTDTDKFLPQKWEIKLPETIKPGKIELTIISTDMYGNKTCNDIKHISNKNQVHLNMHSKIQLNLLSK